MFVSVWFALPCLLYASCRKEFEARKEMAKMGRQRSQDHPPDPFSLLCDDTETERKYSGWVTYVCVPHTQICTLMVYAHSTQFHKYTKYANYTAHYFMYMYIHKPFYCVSVNGVHCHQHLSVESLVMLCWVGDLQDVTLNPDRTMLVWKFLYVYAYNLHCIYSRYALALYHMTGCATDLSFTCSTISGEREAPQHGLQ